MECSRIPNALAEPAGLIRLRSPLARGIRRTLEVLLVVVMGLFLVPVMALVAVLIKMTSPGPVFYGQERIGRGGKRFRLWKFRTMLADAENILEEYLHRHPELKEQWDKERKLQDDPRITPGLGHFLRRSSLDELPQLWNVVKGEMSLVGPRPLPQYHLEHFSPEFCQFRAKVTPGITGLWQVSSRTESTPEMFLEWDTRYIEEWSVLLDLEILLRTVWVTLSGTGA